jgi:hypothetical protein
VSIVIIFEHSFFLSFFMLCRTQKRPQLKYPFFSLSTKIKFPTIFCLYSPKKVKLEGGEGFSGLCLLFGLKWTSYWIMSEFCSFLCFLSLNLLSSLCILNLVMLSFCFFLSKISRKRCSSFTRWSNSQSQSFKSKQNSLFIRLLNKQGQESLSKSKTEENLPIFRIESHKYLLILFIEQKKILDIFFYFKCHNHHWLHRLKYKILTSHLLRN